MSVRVEGSENGVVNGCNQLTKNGAALRGYGPQCNPQEMPLSSIKPPLT